PVTRVGTAVAGRGITETATSVAGGLSPAASVAAESGAEAIAASDDEQQEGSERRGGSHGCSDHRGSQSRLSMLSADPGSGWLNPLKCERRARRAKRLQTISRERPEICAAPSLHIEDTRVTSRVAPRA